MLIYSRNELFDTGGETMERLNPEMKAALEELGAAAKKLGPEAIRDLARKLEFTAGVLDIQGERKKAG